MFLLTFEIESSREFLCCSGVALAAHSVCAMAVNGCSFFVADFSKACGGDVGASSGFWQLEFPDNR